MLPEDTVPVWDPLLRIFHWLLVIGFFSAYLIEPEDSAAHYYAGYAVAALLAFRIPWGVVGSAHARFSDFIYSPAAVVRDLVDILFLRSKRYVGHSPAGGAMVLALLLLLLATTVSGLMVYGADQHAGPLAQWMAGISESGEKALEEIHEAFANATLAMVVLHIVGAVYSSFSHKENLILAMITGRKRR